MHMRNALTYVTIGVIVVSIGGIGFYLEFTDSSASSGGLNAVKSSSSFDKISEEGEVDIRSYDIGGNTISLSKESNYPYDWSAKNIGNKNSTFAMAVDFADFKEEESRLVFVNSSKSAHIYQLQDKSIISNISGIRLVNEIMQTENERQRNQACSNSNITIEHASMTSESFSVKLSVSGNGLARWIHVDVNLNGERIEKDEVIDAGESQSFNFKQVESLEKIEEVSISTHESDSCNFDKKTLSELPVKN